MMFFGRTSSRMEPSRRRRRQRLRRAIATARLASFCPTMKRSSSETISRGEKSVMAKNFPGAARSFRGDRFEHEIGVGIDANPRCDFERAAGDRLGVETGIKQRAARGKRIIAARADPHDAA